LVRNGDQLYEKPVPPPRREHHLHVLEDLVAALKDTAIAPAPEVYVRAEGVYAYLDRSDRRSCVFVPLEESQRFQLCKRLEAQPLVADPKSIVRLLKTSFLVGTHEHVTLALSNITFERTSTGKTEVKHGKESLGRSVEAAVQQAENVPEEFTITVPIWTTSGFDRFSGGVDFGLYLDLEQQKVVLQVLSDECVRVRNLAMLAAIATLQDKFGDLKVPIFLGEP